MHVLIVYVLLLQATTHNATRHHRTDAEKARKTQSKKINVEKMHVVCTTVLFRTCKFPLLNTYLSSPSSRCAHINFNNEIITLLCKIVINRQIEEITKKTEIYRGATTVVRLEFVYYKCNKNNNNKW